MPIVSSKGLTPKSSVLTEKELKHLLRRTTFGLSRELLAKYQNKALNKVIDELLEFSPEYEQPLTFVDNPAYYGPGEVFGKTWVNLEIYSNGLGERRNSFQSNLIQKQIQSKDITEKLTLFLHHFIPINEIDINPERVYWNYKLLRDNCLGNFKKIIRDISTNAAMLIYLNGFNNKVGKPDENYARELMELFTLGKNYSPIYNESDIKEAAKVLTGYYFGEPYGYNSAFIPSRHDSTNKTFSSFFNNKVIKGQTGYNGEKELDELIDMIFSKEEVSIYFVTRLYRFFVYYEIDDIVKNNVILPLAKIFRENNYDIKPVLNVLFKSEHFYDTNVVGSYIKNPLDLICGITNEFNFLPYTQTNITQRYFFYWEIYSHKIKILNMYPYSPPDVAGWRAYYEEPLMYENWITSSTILSRVEQLTSFFTNYGYGLKIDVIEAVKKYSNPSNINELIDEVLDWHLTIEPTQDLKNHMKSILLFGQVEEHYWTDLWNAHIANPSNPQTKDLLTKLLKQFYEYLVSLPEYQLM